MFFKVSIDSSNRTFIYCMHGVYLKVSIDANCGTRDGRGITMILAKGDGLRGVRGAGYFADNTSWAENDT